MPFPQNHLEKISVCMICKENGSPWVPKFWVSESEWCRYLLLWVWEPPQLRLPSIPPSPSVHTHPPRALPNFWAHGSPSPTSKLHAGLGWYTAVVQGQAQCTASSPVCGLHAFPEPAHGPEANTQHRVRRGT